MTTNRLELAIAKAVAQFTSEILGIIRTATVAELAGVNEAPRRTPESSHARPPKAPAKAVPSDAPTAPESAPAPPAVETRLEVEPEAPPEAKASTVKPRKKRAWPSCTFEGCDNKMYGPSGKARLCYQHHREAGGKPSPFAKRRAKPSVKPGAIPRQGTAAQQKVILRKAGATNVTGSTEAAGQVSEPKPDPKKRAEVLAELRDGGKKP